MRQIAWTTGVIGSLACTNPSAAQPASTSSSSEPAKVEIVAGARWSPSLGLVSARPNGDFESGTEPEATASLLQLQPRPQTPSADTGAAPRDSRDSSKQQKRSFGSAFAGIGSLELDPASSTRAPAFASASGLELSLGLKYVIGGAKVGGWVGFGFTYGFLETQVPGPGSAPKTYSLSSIPVALRGGVDFHATQFLDLGPRVGGQVGPYAFRLKDDGTSSSSTSPGGGTSKFAAFYEYGGQVRLRSGSFLAEPAFVWRQGGDVSSRHFTLNAMMELGKLQVLGWFETRLSSDGQPDTSSEFEAFAEGMPEAQRIGLGLGVALL